MDETVEIILDLVEVLDKRARNGLLTRYEAISIYCDTWTWMNGQILEIL